jgi:hypothetical protein
VAALESGTVVGRYRVEGMLGRGGMAAVYSARHVELGRRVALKVISGELSSDPEFVARFRREGQMQASLENPHVVTVYEAGESEHGLYLALQLVQGSTLAALMAERQLGAGRALALLRQVAEALNAAHAAGLVHRDVKPQNVLVGESDDAHLGDFGLTRVGGAAGVTATGKLVGTVSYLAPEVIHGEEATPASDRYAFAATVFECLTGTVVYPRQTEAAILYAHTSEPPPRISRRRAELPQALDDLFARALAKDPGKRPKSARELVDSVAGVLEEAGASTIGPPPPPGASALEGTTVEPLPRVEPPQRGIGVGRRMAMWLAGAALAGAAVAAAIAIALDDGGGGVDQAAAVPALLPGATALGSDLAQPGRTLDCRGRAPRPSSPGCHSVQLELPGKTLVVPEDGVIRRWAVRSARGELRLSVIRPRGHAFQVSRSRNEFAGNEGVHVFDTNQAVERGDLVGVFVIPGSAVGTRAGVDGASVRRWIPNVVEGKRTGGTDQELLMRADFFPGGKQQVPGQVTGAKAATLEPGRVRARRKLRFTNGRPVEVRLVELDGGFAIDQFLNGRRDGRMDVPDFRPRGGRILSFDVSRELTEPAQLNITFEFAEGESERILHHTFASYPGEFEFIE